ncbi:MAG: SUMF1/EgtB/PvdO family nonheme iron enzyme [Thermodesulfobacteriota bacterium]
MPPAIWIGKTSSRAWTAGSAMRDRQTAFVCSGGFRGSGPSKGARPLTAHVLRGGSWNNNDRNCRSANRNRNQPDNRNNNNGFRVVLHFPGPCGPPGIDGFMDPSSVAVKVLALLLRHPVFKAAGQIRTARPGGTGILRGERPARFSSLKPDQER